MDNFIKGLDFCFVFCLYMKQVCSVVQISGFFLCLVGAARITHRAQRIVSIATRWNMLVTCASSGPDQSKTHTQEAHADPYCGETDSDSDNFISVSPLDPSSFQTRQALGQYNILTKIYNFFFFTKFFYLSFLLVILLIKATKKTNIISIVINDGHKI